MDEGIAPYGSHIIRFDVQILSVPVAALLLSVVALAVETDDDARVLDSIDARGVEFFESRIRPIIIEHCLECHGEDPDSLKGGLDLTSAGGLLRGGESGPVVVPGDPDGSPLYQAVTYADQEFAMPPRGRLTRAEIRSIRDWIEMGAPDPRTGTADQAPASDDARDPWLDPHGQGREHWAYVPMDVREPPMVEGDEWSRTGVDRFVLARLREAGIEPGPEADPRTLSRRAHFDLVGLPPTPEQMNRFLADHERDPDGAWTRLVERLLDSPHYGERWARHWLDVVRYADSNGLDENTAFGNAWKYRDWVVRAFNRDLPYDKFVTMQIAGDLLPEPADREAAVDNLLATGFLSLGPKVLAEPDKEKMLVDLVDEQLDVLGKTFLAQTVGCARCHDHKFDPIPHDDYYAMAGILISTRTMQSLDTVARVLERNLATKAEIEALGNHVEATERNRQELAASKAEAASRLAEAWSSRTADAMRAAATLTTTPRVREAEDAADTNLGANFDRWGDGVGVLHTVREDPTQFVEYEIDASGGGEWLIRIRYASGESRPVRLLAGGTEIRAEICGETTGGFDVANLRWTTIRVDLPEGTNRIRFERAGAFPHVEKISLAGPDAMEAHREEIERVAVENSIDPSLLRRWAEALAGDSIFVTWRAYAAIAPDEWMERAPVLTRDLQDRFASDAVAADGVDGRSGATPLEIPFIRSIIEGPSPRSLDGVADRWQAATSLVLDSWNRQRDSAGEEQPDRLTDPAREIFRLALLGESGVLGGGSDLASHYSEELGRRIASLEEERKSLESTRPPAILRGIVVEEAEARDLPVFIRGDHTNKREDTVPRGFMTVLSGTVPELPIPEDGSGRFELADWITNPEHPLTSRTMINRIWAWHFGRGIVATPSNFGLRGGRPSHPGLLDWMSRKFVSEGWSIKQMHRLIMESAVYRLSGDEDPAAIEIDPANDLWWRREPRRLEAEPIRDAIFAVGGNLDLEVGGSLLRSSNFGYVTNDQSNSNESYDHVRRALYMPVIRNDMYSLFATFDYTDPSISLESRPSTVVAQQSLFMMNSPMVASQAESLAGRILADGSRDDAERVSHAYEICFGRTAESHEIDRALAFVGRMELEGGPDRSHPWPPREGIGDRDAELIDARHAAWRSLCRVLIASNEFIYVR
mgnify:CR=1 FL=1